MVKIVDECCGCATESYPCLGSACPNRNVEEFFCDECKEQVDELYLYDNEELCLECVEKRLEKI